MTMDAIHDDLSPGTLELLRGVSSATITGQLAKKHLMRTRSVAHVAPLDIANCRFVGPAFTLRYGPVREDLAPGGIRMKANPVQEAIDSVPAGAVLMIDLGGDASIGALGDILVARLIANRCAGVVCDGGMRDRGQIMHMGLPIFCAGWAPPPSNAEKLGLDFQTPIGCGNALVYPGDIIVADEDGVAVIPRVIAAEVARDGAEQERAERFIRRRIEQGAPIRGTYPLEGAMIDAYRAWVDAGEPEE
jgi:regulator of RNase E activity RraA